MLNCVKSNKNIEFFLIQINSFSFLTKHFVYISGLVDTLMQVVDLQHYQLNRLDQRARKREREQNLD
jgi:hypothetical protein